MRIHKISKQQQKLLGLLNLSGDDLRAMTPEEIALVTETLEELELGSDEDMARARKQLLDKIAIAVLEASADSIGSIGSKGFERGQDAAAKDKDKEETMQRYSLDTESKLTAKYGARKASEYMAVLLWCYSQNICGPILEESEDYYSGEELYEEDESAAALDDYLDLPHQDCTDGDDFIWLQEEHATASNGDNAAEQEGVEVEFDGLFDLDDVISYMPSSRALYTIEWQGDLSPGLREHHIRKVLQGKLPRPYFFMPVEGIDSDAGSTTDKEVDSWCDLQPNSLTISRMGTIDVPKIAKVLLDSALEADSFHQVYCHPSNPTPLFAFNSYINALRREVV